MTLPLYTKDPNAILDYTINWAPFLGVDTISTSAWIVPSGITNVTDTKTTTTTTIWLSGGTIGSFYDLTNRIVSVGGRTDDRTIRVRIKDR